MKLRCVVVAGVLIVAIACTANSPTAPWWESPAAPPAVSLSIVGLTLEPKALSGGSTSVGTVTVYAPAPAGGTSIALSSSDASAAVPASVLIAPGTTSVTFAISTRAVSTDSSATITASTSRTSLRATLSIWTIAPNDFWYDSAPTDFIGVGAVGHLTGPVGFQAGCDGSQLYVQISGGWDLDFSAPAGQPLRAGTYEGATRDFFSPSHPGLNVASPGRGCPATGRFVVAVADFATTGEVHRFAATFEQQCVGNTGTLRGALMLTNPALGIGGASPRHCLQ